MQYMEYGKKLGISFLVILAFLLGFGFLLTVLNYFNLVTGTFYHILKFLVPILSFLIGGFSMGRGAKEKGWLEGIKLSLLMILFFMLFTYLGIGEKIGIQNFIYYFILMTMTMLGSMFGINHKRKD